MPAESPFKTRSFSPLRALPGMDCPSKILIDPAHTFAIQGFGKDMAASCTVLLGVHMGVFGGNNIGEKLDLAFISFKDFCKRAGKYTSITEFSLQEFRATSPFGQNVAPVLFWPRVSASPPIELS